MPFSPPLIKPPLPPLRPPVAPPYRPPGPNRLPPTQTVPIYQPPDLLPPTGLDLKGVVCIYSNAPLWEPKKIRYKYPGENWKEIAGENYTTKINDLGWESLPLLSYRIDFSAEGWCWSSSGPVNQWSHTVQGGFKLISTGFIYSASIRNWPQLINAAFIPGQAFNLWDQNGTRNVVRVGPGSGHSQQAAVEFNSYGCTGIVNCSTCQQTSGQLQQFRTSNMAIKQGSLKVDRVVRVSDNQTIPPDVTCTFTVFNIFGQEILSITKDICPEVEIIPERCYFKAENERLVARVIQTLLDPPLRIQYQGHCATVWKDGIINLPPYPLQIYKECSDFNCPPPRIRFDQKCEEKCEQCPPGTTIKVLLGSRIACVSAVGCVLKNIKYKPGCNNYACICS